MPYYVKVGLFFSDNTYEITTFVGEVWTILWKIYILSIIAYQNVIFSNSCFIPEGEGRFI